MKSRTVGLAACVLGLVGCAAAPSDGATVRVGPFYEAMGDVEGISASLYGRRTVLQLDPVPARLDVYDLQAGRWVGAERLGRSFRLDSQLKEFRVFRNLASAVDVRWSPEPGALPLPRVASPHLPGRAVVSEPGSASSTEPQR